MQRTENSRIFSLQALVRFLRFRINNISNKLIS